MPRAPAAVVPEPSAALHQGDAVRIRGERWVVIHQSMHAAASVLDVRGAESSNAGQVARFLLPVERLERVATPSVPRVVRPPRFRHLARSLLAAATPAVDSLRVAVRAAFDVMPYQLEPALAVTRGLGSRLLIADEVGLGKTVQAGLLVAEVLERTPDGRALIVCPAGLRRQWRDELQARFGLASAMLDSAGLGRVTSTLEGAANPWAAVPLVIASIDFVKRPDVMRALEGLIWDVVVLDEAHNLASHSDRATAAAALARRARTVVTLSATPHSGDEAAFARLCALGDAHGRFPLLVFRRTRTDAGLPVQRRSRWLQVRPTTAESQMHDALAEYARRVWRERDAGPAARLAIAVLLRRAGSSAGSLARSLERRLAGLEATPAAADEQLVLPFANTQSDEAPAGALLAPGLTDRREERWHLERVLGLARLAAGRESKITVLRRWIDRVRQPVLVFTEYRDTLAQLRQALVRGGVPPARIAELHGGLTGAERADAERAFTAGAADVLLATDAASEGLNLHHRCRCVITLECPWSPVRLEQRIGRVDRIGQRRVVHAIHLVAAGTFEQTTVRRLLDRAARAAGALNAGQPSDEEIADAVLSGADVPEPRRVSLLSGLTRVDLRPAAALEADRILRARRLGSPVLADTRRPFATVLRRRRSRRGLWVFEVVITDAAGFPAWSTLVALEGSGVPGLGSRASMQATVAAIAERLRPPAHAAAQQVRRVTTETLHGALALAVEREQAIAAGVRLRHARIAADLLQPGLFDRRAERRATSQSLVLEEALGRCHTRLDALARLADPRIEPPALRFAVLLG